MDLLVRSSSAIPSNTYPGFIPAHRKNPWISWHFLSKLPQNPGISRNFSSFLGSEILALTRIFPGYPEWLYPGFSWLFPGLNILRLTRVFPGYPGWIHPDFSWIFLSKLPKGNPGISWCINPGISMENPASFSSGQLHSKYYIGIHL